MILSIALAKLLKAFITRSSTTFWFTQDKRVTRMTSSAALRVVVVVAMLAGSLALAHTPNVKLRLLAEMLRQEKTLQEQRSTHWAANLTTVSEGGKEARRE